MKKITLTKNILDNKYFLKDFFAYLRIIDKYSDVHTPKEFGDLFKTVIFPNKIRIESLRVYNLLNNKL